MTHPETIFARFRALPTVARFRRDSDHEPARRGHLGLCRLLPTKDGFHTDETPPSDEWGNHFVLYLDGRARLAAEIPFSRGMLAPFLFTRDHGREIMQPEQYDKYLRAIADNRGIEVSGIAQDDGPDSHGRRGFLYTSMIQSGARIWRDEETNEPLFGDGLDTHLVFSGKENDLPALDIRTPEDCFEITKEVDEHGYNVVKAPERLTAAVNAAQAGEPAPPVRFWGVYWGVEEDEQVRDSEGKIRIETKGYMVFWHAAGGGRHYPFQTPEDRDLAVAINARNYRLGFKYPGLLGRQRIIGEEYPSTDKSDPPSKFPTRTTRDPLPSLGALNAIGSTRLMQGVALNLGQVARWTASDTPHNHHEMTTAGVKRRSTVTTSWPSATWEALAKHKSARLLKSFWALEARRYAESDPFGIFLVTPEWIARELTDERESKKITSKEKQRAAEFIRAMMALRCTYTFLGRDKQIKNISGPYYHEIGTLEHEDLFGYEPTAIALRFNVDLHGQSHREHSRQMFHFCRAFLSLNAKTDSMAIQLGSYMMLKGRCQTHDHEPGEARFRNRTLLSILIKSGEIDVAKIRERREWHLIPGRVEAALDKLIAKGTFAKWSYTRTPPEPAELDIDADDDEFFANQIEAMISEKLPTRIEAWVGNTTSIVFGGEEVDAQVRAREVRREAIATAAKRKRGRPRKTPEK